MALDIDMLQPELLNLLCCPETHQSLRIATREELAFISREGVVNRAGKPIQQPVTDGLVREDGAVLYPIWDDIPCLLVEEGISLRSSSVAC